MISTEVRWSIPIGCEKSGLVRAEKDLHTMEVRIVGMV
jgi:hypothetical protein